MTTKYRGAWIAGGVSFVLVILLGVFGWLPSDAIGQGVGWATGASGAERPTCKGDSTACEEAGTRDKAKRHYRQHDWGQSGHPWRHVTSAHPAVSHALASAYRQGVHRWEQHHRSADRLANRTWAQFRSRAGCTFPLAHGLQAASAWCLLNNTTEEHVLQPIRRESFRIIIDCSGAYIAGYTGKLVEAHKITSAVLSKAMRVGSGAVAGCVAGHIVYDVVNNFLGKRAESDRA